MNRRDFCKNSMAASVGCHLYNNPGLPASNSFEPGSKEGVTVLLIDTDRASTRVDQRVYGQFLEHINHSVVDGLFAEQIRGAGFEGEDFKTYWEISQEHGEVDVVNVDFQNGKKSVRLKVQGGHAAIHQGRLFLDAGVKYDGSIWVRRELGSPKISVSLKSGKGESIASISLPVTRSDWQQMPFSFTSTSRDTDASIQISVGGTGSALLDFVSMMRSDVRSDGMLRPDLLKALRELRPSFIRWPGGSFASTYKWQDAIGPQVARRYHPNLVWGGYSDYYGFGTDEFLGLCKKIGAEPLIVLAAPGTRPDQVEYAMDWVHYLNDPPSTQWGQRRAANGHPEPYGVTLFQIDNEPMNSGFTPEAYAEIVNVYGRRLREIVPNAQIVACGQKRSSDMEWSETIIDLAGENFDILGCHNYEYEPDNFETGLRRIRDYLVKLRDYIRASRYPRIELGVLEWSLQHTYDWRAGLHTAGSLILYEELSPGLTMTCPALLMRNTTDDPRWTSFIYHDHVSWFPGAGYVVEKLFREHYAERTLATATGSIRDVPDRSRLVDKISTFIPEQWIPGSVDAIATTSLDGRRIVVKAVNYTANRNALFVRVQGSRAPSRAISTLHTITAKLNDAASLQDPEAIAPIKQTIEYARDFSVDLEPFTVAVIDIRAD